MKYFILLAITLLLGGCTSSNTPESSNALDSTYLSNVSLLLGDGGKNETDSTGQTIASNINWKDSLGNLTSLESLRGKIIVLNFFTTWCGPCRKEMPYFNHLADSLRSKIAVIAISIDGFDSSLYYTMANLKRFADKQNIKFQLILDLAPKTYVNYGAHDFIPWTFIIDRKGRIFYTFKGTVDSEKNLTDIFDQIP